MTEKEQEEKQNYLRQNILDKGYDANDFVSFLQSKKGEGASDISNWSMTDLQKVVKEYILKHSEEKKNSDVPPTENNDIKEKNNNNNSDIQSQKQNIANDYEIIENINSINKDNNNSKKEKIPLKDENFGIIINEYIDCQKSEINDLNDKENLEITVTDPKVINNGFFSKTFVNFLITTNPINLKVRRKHYDFVWLRERLSIIYNLNVLPRLPKKGKVYGDNHINKRMRSLQNFLNYLLKDDLIKNSQIFYDFLSIEKDEDFEKKKKIYNKLRTPTEFKDIKSLEGKLKIEVTPQNEILLDKIRDNSILNESILKQINDNFKLLKLEMDAVITRVLSFFPMFDKLIKARKIYLPNNVILESYIQLKNIFKSWSEVLKKQNYFFSKDVKEYLKILGGNYHHMKELAESVEEQKNYYKKIVKNLIQKKIDLYDTGDIEDWQLDSQDKKKVKTFFKDKSTSYKKICYNNTCEAIKLKEKYGYQLNKIISEHNRLKIITNIESRQKVMDFTRKQSQISSDHIIIMGKIIGIMDDCFENQNSENKEQNDIEINEIKDEDNNIENNEIKDEQKNNGDNIGNKKEEDIKDKDDKDSNQNGNNK